MRILLFTGKGGVGKTTIATATAVRVAASGRKALVMSTDPAHSLADALECDIGPQTVEVAPNLWAEQIDPQQRLEENWREIQEHAMAVLKWAGLDEIEAEELSVVPGLDELLALADVKRHHDEGPYDVVIVDCAPTGETLRLLALPDIIQWYMERIFPIERRVIGALRPVARKITSLPLPNDRVYEAVMRFYNKLDGVRRVLTEAETTSVRLVVNPEQMVVAEAKRTFTYLNLFGYRVDAIVVNRLLPDEVSDPFFDRWKSLQKRHLATIHDAFSPIPLLMSHLRDQEMVGAERLDALGQSVYGSVDPADVLYTDDPMTIGKQGDDYLLSLRLPFAHKEALDLSRKGDELFVRVGQYRRTIMLPKSLAARKVASANLEGERVNVIFERGAST